MKKVIKRIKLVSIKSGAWFLWFTTHKEKDYCLFWEFSGPIWILPKIQKGKKYMRIGWLWFACGVGKA
jgi:hypothetical protein